VPCWGSQGRDVPPETQFLLLELVEGGPYAVLLPLIDHGAFRATLRPSGSGAESCVGYVVMLLFDIFERPVTPFVCCLQRQARHQPAHREQLGGCFRCYLVRYGRCRWHAHHHS
jgi:Raffinose synthase or seed imbibition protein Sip1